MKVAPGADGPDDPYGVKGVRWYYIPKGYWQDDSITQEYEIRYDYALLILYDTDFNNGWHGFASKSYSNLKNTLVWTAGYPWHASICDDSPEPDDWCGNFQYADDCNLDKVYTSYTKYRCDMYESQSGSPVYHYNDGNRQVVGIHHGGNSDWNYGNRVRDGSFDSLCEWIGWNETNHSHDCY